MRQLDAGQVPRPRGLRLGLRHHAGGQGACAGLSAQRASATSETEAESLSERSAFLKGRHPFYLRIHLQMEGLCGVPCWSGEYLLLQICLVGWLKK